MTTISANETKSPYRPEIDGLRALAIVAVIINHFNDSLMRSGYLGVDIFFVISGYVITSSLCHSEQRSLGHFLLDFYVRRIKRLAPVLMLFVLSTSVLICFFDPDPETSLKTGAAGLFGLSNLYLFQNAADYFAVSSELNVFTNTWSLGVEEQFYFIFPLLLWFSGLGRSHSGRRNFELLVIPLLLSSFVMFSQFSKSDAAAAFYLMPARFWELGAGCLLFATFNHERSASVATGWLSLSALLLLIVVLFVFSDHRGVSNLLVVALTALLIATLSPGTRAYTVLTNPYILYLGLISYSLYLWHWSVLSLSRWTIGIHVWSAPIQIALMFLLASASYHYVEQPFRRIRWSSVRWKSLSYGLGGSTAIATILMFLILPSHAALFLGTRRTHFKSDILASNPSVVQAAEALRIKCNMTPHHLKGSAYRPQPLINDAFLQDCMGGEFEGEKNPTCGRQFRISIHITLGDCRA